MALVVVNASEVMADLSLYREMMRSMPKGLAKKHIRAAMNRILKPYKPIFANAVPVKSGGLKKSVGTMVRFTGKEGHFMAKVGYRRSKRFPGWHAMIVDEGTKPRFTKAGKFTGIGPARRFSSSIAGAINGSAPQVSEAEIVQAVNAAVAEMPTYLLKSSKRRGK